MSIKKNTVLFFSTLAFSQVHAQQVFRCPGTAGEAPQYINSQREVDEFKEKGVECKLVSGGNIKVIIQQTAKTKPPSAKRGVAIGMTKADVMASSWGKPRNVLRTTTARGTQEQWIYGPNNYLYFDDGILTTIQN